MEPIHKNVMMQTTYEDYGQGWMVDDGRTLKELGENEIKLQYLEKCYKSMRRAEIMKNKSQGVETNNEKYKYDKNAIISRKFPFEASQFHYPNDGQEKPKSLYITTNDTYGKQKPNDLELPEKYHPINNTFTKEFNAIMYRNQSLNCAASRSKVHSSLDSVY
ncbi:MAG: DUF4490 domain-containing protein [archaeon]|nr:DUF4490 domain-containing protein [archaeon]